MIADYGPQAATQALTSDCETLKPNHSSGLEGLEGAEPLPVLAADAWLDWPNKHSWQIMPMGRRVPVHQSIQSLEQMQA